MPASGSSTAATRGPPKTTSARGWGSFILPQLEQRAVYDAINFNLTMTFSQNFTAQLLRFNSYLCPSDSTLQTVPVRNQENSATVYTVGCGNYVGMYGLGEIGE